jgi:hypothetical protein
MNQPGKAADAAHPERSPARRRSKFLIKEERYEKAVGFFDRIQRNRVSG